MANTFAPFGFMNTGVFNGASPTFQLVTARIDRADTTAIFKNDPVKLLNTGYVAQWTAATPVRQLAGVFQGCRYLSAAEGKEVWSPYWPGSGAAANTYVTAYLSPCIPSTPQTFLVQNDGAAITFADVGLNADVAIGTGNTLTGMSGASLDQSTLADTATLPFRVIGLYEGVGNGSDAASSYNWVMVAANVTGTQGI